MKSLFFLLGLFGLLNCSAQKSNKVLKLAHGMDVNHPVHKAMVFMADEVNRLSNGQLKVNIYPASQLGSERELLELLQIGSIDISKSSAAVVESFAPDLRILGVPYLFNSEEHMRKVIEGEIGERLLASGTDFYLRGLCFYDAGTRSFYTLDKRVEQPEDLKGLKIRVQPSNTALLMVKSFEAAATPISFGELYTALQQGVVDGAENNLPSFYLTRHFEVCKYYIVDEHTAVPDMLLISEHSWKKLSVDEKSWVKQASLNSYKKMISLWKESEQKALEEIQKAGVEIIHVDKKAFEKQTESILPQILTSPSLEAYYKEIKAEK
ncbi:TRAP transporter substrate-binding protein [bacterium]|nr:MAG: TRAP transporter substrate-binding protein [bacterium]